MNQTTDTTVIDVLVVGAGPVGLFFANLMQQYGCSFRIIDRNDAPSIDNEDFGITARTMEALDNW